LGSSNPGHGIVKAKGFDISFDRFLQIGNRLIFRLTFTIGRQIRYPGGEAPNFSISYEFNYHVS